MDKTVIDIMHDAMILIDVAAENIRGNEKYVSLLDMALEKLTDAEKIINRN